MAWSYKIYTELNFAVQKYFGEIALVELYEVVQAYIEDPEFSKIHYLLIDGSEFCAGFEPEEILRFAKYLNLIKERDNHKTVVVIVTTPREVACAEMFKWLKGKSKRDYCLTFEKAYVLLGLPISYEEFMGKVDDLSFLNDKNNEYEFRRSG